MEYLSYKTLATCCSVVYYSSRSMTSCGAFEKNEASSGQDGYWKVSLVSSAFITITEFNRFIIHGVIDKSNQ